MKQTDIGEAILAMGMTASEPQVSLLLSYERCLEERGGALGVISKHDLERVRERHILDCARAGAASPTTGQAYDLGSGGGLPGIVVAILRPDLAVRLIEVRARKVAFLEWVVEQLRLPNVEVTACRIEDLPPDSADVCFARALASPAESWYLASSLLKPGGILVYFAGANVEIPTTLPEARSVRVQQAKVLESAGPLAIITR